MINLEWLRTFKTVYEKESMTAAASALCTSQPGVSLHLSSLENYVGHQLFQRLPRKLVPTEHGIVLYNAVSEHLSSLESVEKNFQKTADLKKRSVTVGMCFESFQETLEKYLPELSFDLIMEFDAYRALLKKLESGIIDLVVTPNRIDLKDIAYEVFSQENIILAAGSKTDVSGFEKLTASPRQLESWVMKQKWFGVSGSNEHMVRFWKQNFGNTPKSRPNFILPNFHSIIRSISGLEGVAVLPDFLCRKEIEKGTVKVLWRGYKPLTNKIYFAHPKKHMHMELLEHIKSFIRREMPPASEQTDIKDCPLTA